MEDILGSTRSLTIPTADEDIQFPADELPDNAEEIIQIFEAESVKLDVWLSFAREYYSQGKREPFLKILEKAVENEGVVREQARKDGNELVLVDVYDALAGHYLDIASKQESEEERSKLFGKVMTYYNLADDIRPEIASSYTGKGVWAFRSGSSKKDALNHFNIALEIDADFVPAILGKAELLYTEAKYEKALKLYMAALRLYPDAPASLRVEIANCLFHLGKIPEARHALERAIEIDPECADALAAMGIILANSHETHDIASSIVQFQRAFKANSRHPIALNHLANHFMVKKNYEKAMGLAKVAYHSTKVPPLQAESCYIIGRCNQAMGDFEEATSYFRISDRLYKNFIPAQFGLGQMFIKHGEIEKAIQCFLRVEQRYPEDKDTLRILASLCSKSQDKRQQQSSLSRLKKLTELLPNDAEVYIEMGEFLERSQPAEALTAYETAMNLLTEQHRSIPTSLFNNIGALRHHLSGGDPKQLRRAVTAYGLAVRGAGGKLELLGDSETQFSDDVVTSLYNMARVAEDLGEPSRAKALYTTIIEHQPYYIDCWLRLGMMAQGYSDREATIKCYMDAINHDKDSIDAWVLMGNLHLGRKEFLMAQRKYEHILSSIDPQDPYALVALGNVFYYAYYSGGPNHPKASKYCLSSLKYFSKVLSDDPFNVPAAEGACILLAERGRFMEVRDTMTQIAEISDNESCWINVAHAALAQGQFVKAIRIYSMCLRKFSGSGNIAKVMAYLAKAYFEAGEFAECVRVLEKGIHLSPSDPSLRFNLALAKRDLVLKLSEAPLSTPALSSSTTAATTTTQTTQGVGTSAKLREALDGLSVASSILDGLTHSVPEHIIHWHDKVDPIVAQQVAKTVKEARTIGEAALKEKERGEEEFKLRQIELQKELEASERAKKEKEEAEAEALRKAKEEKKARELALHSQSQAIMAQLRDGSGEGKKRKKKRGRNDDKDSDNDDEVDVNMVGQIQQGEQGEGEGEEQEAGPEAALGMVSDGQAQTQVEVEETEGQAEDPMELSQAQMQAKEDEIAALFGEDIDDIDDDDSEDDAVAVEDGDGDALKVKIKLKPIEKEKEKATEGEGEEEEEGEEQGAGLSLKDIYNDDMSDDDDGEDFVPADDDDTKPRPQKRSKIIDDDDE